MARKESITIEDILRAAFEMAREEGIENVTARKLAAKAGCSTQPIFRIYKNMDEMTRDLFEKVINYFDEYYETYPKKDIFAFVDLGMAYIQFAVQEKNLFRLLFLSEKRYGKSLYELLNGKSGAVKQEIARAKSAGCSDPGELFMKMWIFIHGAASMAITGDYDLNEVQTRELLEECYRAFV
ncbi:MAG: TetR/AcrR family transcriptional regulator [Clostridiales bacterium]|nr:TetR/AcrR family transcriptional regulator [Clostridiales bacterium]